MKDVTVQDQWGSVMVRGVDSAGSVRRYWFDETDKGRIALCAIVVEVRGSQREARADIAAGDEITETSGRLYLDKKEWDVPDHIRDALMENGYDAETIYDPRGFEVC